MEKMIDLKDLLKHEILDLYSAEQQMIKAMPAMIEKAKDNTLKKTLQEHLRITEKQKTRLEKIKQLLGEESGTGGNSGNSSPKGFFSSLFKGSGEQKCKGVEGLIEESEKVMGENMTPEVLDAVIIASAQKLEHYEICGYGTAKAFARQLNLGEVAELLEETLNEEYQADDRLTDLAVGGLNKEAEKAEEGQGNRRSRNGNQTSSSNGRSGNRATSKEAASKGGKKSSPSKGSNGSKSSGNRSSSSKSTRTNRSKKSSGRSAAKSSGKKKSSSSRGR